MNNREVMRKTNRIVCKYLLDLGFLHIHLIPHSYPYFVYHKPNYRAIDIFNLFDGICIYKSKPIFIQIKTNCIGKINLPQDINVKWISLGLFDKEVRHESNCFP